MANLDSLYVSCGVMLEATYQVQFLEYTLEDELYGPKISDIKKQKDLFVKKAAYENNILKLKELRENVDGKKLDEFSIEFEKIVKDIKDSYKAYIDALDIVLKIYKEDNKLL